MLVVSFDVLVLRDIFHQGMDSPIVRSLRIDT